MGHIHTNFFSNSRLKAEIELRMKRKSMEQRSISYAQEQCSVLLQVALGMYMQVTRVQRVGTPQTS